MEVEELKIVAQIMYNTILNENIKYYEKAAYEREEYEGKNYAGRELLSFELSVYDIERAIAFREDLNFLNGRNMREYIDMDLNAYLSQLLFVREDKISSYRKFVETISLELLPYTLMRYFTFLEIEELSMLQENVAREREL